MQSAIGLPSRLRRSGRRSKKRASRRKLEWLPKRQRRRRPSARPQKTKSFDVCRSAKRHALPKSKSVHSKKHSAKLNARKHAGPKKRNAPSVTLSARLTGRPRRPSGKRSAPPRKQPDAHSKVESPSRTATPISSAAVAALLHGFIRPKRSRINREQRAVS